MDTIYGTSLLYRRSHAYLVTSDMKSLPERLWGAAVPRLANEGVQRLEPVPAFVRSYFRQECSSARAAVQRIHEIDDEPVYSHLHEGWET